MKKSLLIMLLLPVVCFAQWDSGTTLPYLYIVSNGDTLYFHNDGTYIWLETDEPIKLSAESLGLLNDIWLWADNYANDGMVNIFKVNTDDEIELGSQLNIDKFVYPSADTTKSYTLVQWNNAADANDTLSIVLLSMGGKNYLTFWARADGSNSIKDQTILPNDSATVDLGSASRYFDDFYVDQLHGNGNWRGSDSFSGVAIADTILNGDFASTDIFFASLTHTASMDSVNTSWVEAKTDTLIVHREADGDAGQTYNWWRLK